MEMPFTNEEFLHVFRQYNLAVWPSQIFLNSFALLILLILFFKKSKANILISILLAILWVWTGLIYHIFYFSSINNAAYLFGFLFIIQGVLFAYFGFIKDTLKFLPDLNFASITGSVFILYALIIYPVLAYAFGHTYPEMPTFGLPCPTTIFTFGILLFSVRRIPWYIITIPFLWSLLGFSAAINLSIKEDFGLAIAGVSGFLILLFFQHKTGAVALK